MPKPRQPAPSLDVALVGGGRWRLADQRPDRFTVVAFYRGYHCPLCRSYVTTLNALTSDLAEVGATSVLAVSGDDAGRAERTVAEWEITDLPIGYGLSQPAMRQWGLYISKAIKEGQPNEFSEPGLFLIRPDGTLYSAALSTMPFLRPPLGELVETIRWLNDNDYPARGEI